LAENLNRLTKDSFAQDFQNLGHVLQPRGADADQQHSQLRTIRKYRRLLTMVGAHSFVGHRPPKDNEV